MRLGGALSAGAADVRKRIGLANCVASDNKTYGPEPRLDVGLLLSALPANAAGVFTKNRICGAPVELCRERITSGRARGVIVNSGCSNVATGDQGRADARRMAELAAEHAGIPALEMLVCSTGVIGRPLPMDRIEAGIRAIELSETGGARFARAIMTTDTVTKERAVRVKLAGVDCTIGGAAKGSGMMHPDMATVLCYLTTDAAIEPEWLQTTLREVADRSLNMCDVDMDTSTSDTMLLFANGAAGNEPIRRGHPDAQRFRDALEQLAIELGKALVRDGEGAKTLIEVQVRGAKSEADARIAARTVSSSPLVKTMVAGRDPNLGRLMMAVGRSGAEVLVDRTSVFIGEFCAFERGRPTDVPYRTISASMDKPELVLRLDLGLGEYSATAWGCDMTEEYVRINAHYTT